MNADSSYFDIFKLKLKVSFKGTSFWWKYILSGCLSLMIWQCCSWN